MINKIGSSSCSNHGAKTATHDTSLLPQIFDKKSIGADGVIYFNPKPLTAYEWHKAIEDHKPLVEIGGKFYFRNPEPFDRDLRTTQNSEIITISQRENPLLFALLSIRPRHPDITANTMVYHGEHQENYDAAISWFKELAVLLDFSESEISNFIMKLAFAKDSLSPHGHPDPQHAINCARIFLLSWVFNNKFFCNDQEEICFRNFSKSALSLLGVQKTVYHEENLLPNAPKITLLMHIFTDETNQRHFALVEDFQVTRKLCQRLTEKLCHPAVTLSEQEKAIVRFLNDF